MDKYKLIIENYKKEKKGKEITKHEGNFSLLVWGTAPYLLFSPLFSKYYSEDFGSLVLIVGEKKGVGFFSLDKYIMSTEVTLKKYLQNKEKFTEIEDFNKLNDEIKQLYESSHPDKLKKLNDEELEKVIIRSFEILRDWQIITLFSEALDENLMKKYFTKFKNNKINFKEFLEMSFSIDFESFIFSQNKDLLNLEKVDPYDIQWILGSYLFTPPLNNAEELMKEMLEDHGGIEKIKEEQEKIKIEIEKNKTIAKKFRDNLSQELKGLFDFVKITITLRDTRKEWSLRAITILSNSMREMFVRKGLPAEDIIYSFFEDFVNRIYEKEDYKDQLKKRKGGFLVYYNKKGIETDFVDFNDARKKLFAIMDKSSEEIKEIKGNIASKGYAKAKAWIILNNSDFSKFKEGDILVTSMTRPEFVPLMKKSSAVITDEGGVTCHAAIVSRELGIPCIIGTKNATRCLKDGDEIEVNANKGIVKILNENDN